MFTNSNWFKQKGRLELDFMTFYKVKFQIATQDYQQ
jgi:hypothetical protein